MWIYYIEIPRLRCFTYLSDDDFASPFGLLTQRLIQGLLEENIATSLDDATMISEAGTFLFNNV